VPKAEHPEELEAAADALGDAPVLALVESATGVCNAHTIAASPAVTRLAFGALDFALDVGCDDGDHALLLARSMLVLASAAAALPGPVDGVTTALDAQETGADARRARGLGFAGKLCIHPDQLTPVSQAFAPSAREIAWAEQVLAADVEAGAAKTADGHMVDAPVLARAKRLLASAAGTRVCRG
jgi:citrate lyase subunit beta / citryl-CoA lyase